MESKDSPMPTSREVNASHSSRKRAPDIKNNEYSQILEDVRQSQRVASIMDPSKDNGEHHWNSAKMHIKPRQSNHSGSKRFLAKRVMSTTPA